jgi:RNA polymerase sigma factor (sigma-70 family)
MIKEKPENALIRTEEMSKMFELIEKRLPRSEAQAIVLRYRNHHTIKEVAEKMDVNSRSISRYISKGLSKIRQFFNGKIR